MIRERGAPPEMPKPVVSEMPPAIAPINWWKLDPIERKETLELLAEWVPELVRRYTLNDQIVPPCWFRHEPLVQELLALYQYRNQNQFLPFAPPVAPKEFHYELQLAIGRLRSWVMLTGCNIAEHFEGKIQPWAMDGGAPAALWRTGIDDHITEVLKASDQPNEKETADAA